jgi:hypothetical protein
MYMKTGEVWCVYIQPQEEKNTEFKEQSMLKFEDGWQLW